MKKADPTHEYCALCSADLGLKSEELERRRVPMQEWYDSHPKRWRCGRCQRIFCDSGTCMMAMRSNRHDAPLGPGNAPFDGATVSCCPPSRCTAPDAEPRCS